MGKISKKELADLTWKALSQAFPDSECSLERDLPERLAIRGILSAQCTDVRVNITARELFDVCPKPEDIVSLPEEDLISIIKPCGLYRSKAKSIKTFAGLYCGEWGGRVPQDVEALMVCPGVGKKIANLIVGEVYGIPAVVVDTHCKRVMKRIGITDNDDPLKVEADIVKVFPEDTWIALGHKAVELGRTYCLARNPKCTECPLNSFCRENA